MALILKSLSAATSTGAGTTAMFDIPHADHSLYVNVTGAPDSYSVALEATWDGTNYFTLTTIGSGASAAKFVADSPVIGIRANLTDLEGGTSPTVTAWVAAA